MLHVILSYLHALFHLLSLFLIHFASLNAQLLYKLELSPSHTVLKVALWSLIN